MPEIKKKTIKGNIYDEVTLKRDGKQALFSIPYKINGESKTQDISIVDSERSLADSESLITIAEGGNICLTVIKEHDGRKIAIIPADKMPEGIKAEFQEPSFYDETKKTYYLPIDSISMTNTNGVCFKISGSDTSINASPEEIIVSKGEKQEILSSNQTFDIRMNSSFISSCLDETDSSAQMLFEKKKNKEIVSENISASTVERLDPRFILAMTRLGKDIGPNIKSHIFEFYPDNTPDKSIPVLVVKAGGKNYVYGNIANKSSAKLTALDSLSFLLTEEGKQEHKIEIGFNTKTKEAYLELNISTDATIDPEGKTNPGKNLKTFQEFQNYLGDFKTLKGKSQKTTIAGTDFYAADPSIGMHSFDPFKASLFSLEIEKQQQITEPAEHLEPPQEPEEQLDASEKPQAEKEQPAKPSTQVKKRDTSWLGHLGVGIMLFGAIMMFLAMFIAPWTAAVGVVALAAGAATKLTAVALNGTTYTLENAAAKAQDLQDEKDAKEMGLTKEKLKELKKEAHKSYKKFKSFEKDADENNIKALLANGNSFLLEQIIKSKGGKDSKQAKEFIEKHSDAIAMMLANNTSESVKAEANRILNAIGPLNALFVEDKLKDLKKEAILLPTKIGRTNSLINVLNTKISQLEEKENLEADLINKNALIAANNEEKEKATSALKKLMDSRTTTSEDTGRLNLENKIKETNEDTAQIRKEKLGIRRKIANIDNEIKKFIENFKGQEEKIKKTAGENFNEKLFLNELLQDAQRSLKLTQNKANALFNNNYQALLTSENMEQARVNITAALKNVQRQITSHFYEEVIVKEGEITNEVAKGALKELTFEEQQDLVKAFEDYASGKATEEQLELIKKYRRKVASISNTSSEEIKLDDVGAYSAEEATAIVENAFSAEEIEILKKASTQEAGGTPKSDEQNHKKLKKGSVKGKFPGITLGK